MEGNKLVKHLLRSKCKSAFYKNRPRPLPKKLRKYMQPDCVLDEHNHTVSIAEYNYMHKTNYSLDDVYGKGYMESLSEDERETIVKQIATCGKLKIQDDLPDTLYTRASVALGRGIVDGDFDEFESLLSNQVKNINYKSRTITGKSDVLQYWKGWRTRYVEAKKVQWFEVAHSNYYSNTCLLLENMIVLFIIHDGLIAMTFMSPRILNGMVGHKGDLLDFPLELDSIRSCLTKIKALQKLMMKKQMKIGCRVWHAAPLQRSWNGIVLCLKQDTMAIRGWYLCVRIVIRSSNIIRGFEYDIESQFHNNS